MIRVIPYRPRDPDSEDLEERYRGFVTLPKMLLPAGKARKLDEARWAADEAHKGQELPDGALQATLWPNRYLISKGHKPSRLMDCHPDLSSNSRPLPDPYRIRPLPWDGWTGSAGRYPMHLTSEPIGRGLFPSTRGINGEDEILPFPHIKRSDPWVRETPSQPLPWPTSRAAPSAMPFASEFQSHDHFIGGAPSLHRNPPRGHGTMAPSFAGPPRAGHVEGWQPGDLPYLSTMHNEIRREAARYPAAAGAREWSNVDGIVIGGLKALGFQPADQAQERFKRQWIADHRDTLIAAAKRFDLPPELVAGVAFEEVGGKPPVADRVSEIVRSENSRAIPVPDYIPYRKDVDRLINSPEDHTSYGPLEVQFRTAATALGYDGSRPLSETQARVLRREIEDPGINIFISAKHISDLRDQIFRGKRSDQIGPVEALRLAAMYNGGPNASPENKAAWKYGDKVVGRLKEARAILNRRR